MAQGDVVFFDQFLVDVQEKVHDLENDTIKLALITDAVTPSATTTDPRWGAGGSTNLSTSEVTVSSPMGNYAAGGATMANPAVTLSGGAALFDADNVSWAQHANNPTDAGGYAIIYNSTAAGKNCIGYVDIGGAFDMTTGDLSVTWGSSISSLNQA